MKIIDCPQGSREWLARRPNQRNSSEAAAVMGFDKKVSRNDMLRMKATGSEREFTEWQREKLLERGHEIEAFARPLAEQFIGDDLYPVVGTDDEGYLSASFDGLVMSYLIAWECKSSNAALRAALDADDLPNSHWPQVEQGLYVSGAETAIFTISDGTEPGTRHMEYRPKPKRRAALLAAWKQFDEDLANYAHIEPAPRPVADPISALPALVVAVEGRVLSSNLATWHDTALAFVASINTNLQSDQDFANAEEAVKFLDDVEKRLEYAKDQALAQTESIDNLFHAIDEVRGEMRAKRLELNRLVESRKKSIRTEIEQRGKQALADHIAALNARIGGVFMPTVTADFAGRMKGKRTVASLNDAVDTELANAKIAANEIADRIQINLKTYGELAAGHELLFADLKQIVTQQAEAFTAMVENRISKHAEAERKRVEAESAKQNAEAPSLAPQAAATENHGASPAVATDVAVAAAPSPAPVTHIGVTGSGRLRDLIDDELSQMDINQLQQALDAVKAIRAKKAA